MKLGYEVRRPDGTTILAPAIPGLGLHGSLHPSGLIKISDNLGFDRRLDLRSEELLTSAKPALEAFVEELLASFERGPDIDEDVIALSRPGLAERRLFRTTRFGIDIDPFAALNPPGMEFPFVYVDQEAIPQYLKTAVPAPGIMFAPRSRRVILVTAQPEPLSIAFDLGNPLDFVRRFPFADQIADVIEETLDHFRTLEGAAGIDPFGYLRTQFEKLDQDVLASDFTKAFVGSGLPVFRRFTSEGFRTIGVDKPVG